MKPVIDSVIAYISPTKAQLIDFVDHCSYRYTPLLLAVFIFITGTIDTFGKPINCMVPTEFSEHWSDYVHQFCYVTGTYLKDIARGGKLPAARVYVDYYQWVPFVLMLQALLMRVPLFFWRYGQSSADIDFAHVHTICANIRNGEAEHRLENVHKAANYILQVAKRRGRRDGLGSKAAYLYLLSKCVNILALAAQIYFLTIFVGYRNPYWGITLTRQVWGHRNQTALIQYFPRVAYCEFGRDFLGHGSGQLEQEVRCTLGINMLNEKVFLVLYFWYYALLALAIMDLVWRLFLLFFTVYSKLLLDELLGLVNSKAVFGDDIEQLPTADQTVAHFQYKVLGRDGLLLFHFLEQNYGKLVVTEVCSALFHAAHRK